MASFDVSAIMNALQGYSRRETRQPNNRAVKQYLLNKGVPERIAWSTSFNELCYWTQKELDEVFNELHLPDDTPLHSIISFQIQTPSSHPNTTTDFVKPSIQHIEESAGKLGALCVDRHGQFCTNPKEGFVALSHVWSQGLGADDDNRGLHNSLLTQVFDRIEPLNLRWMWTDSLAIPGGKRALNLLEEELKGTLINAMANIYKQAKYVVILDALCLRLDSVDPVKVAAVASLGVWMTRMWTYQEIKLASNAVIATKSGFVSFSSMVRSLESLALNEAGQDWDSNAPGRYPSIARTFRRLQRNDEMGVSLPDLAFGCANREAWDRLDYARALFPTLGVDWMTSYTISEAMHLLYSQQKNHATRLALYHGPPRASLPGWAPATFTGLIDGEIIEPGIWKGRGMERSWMTTKVKSIVRDMPGTLVLALESDFADGAMTVGFVSEQTQKESPESVEIFREAVKAGNAYLLADEPLVPKRHMSRVGLLVERFTQVQELEAWVCLTLAVGETEETYKAEKTNWLLLHENPVSKESFSGRGFTELTHDITKVTQPAASAEVVEYPLLQAAQDGDVEECKMLLRVMDANTIGMRGWTALHAAAVSDQRQIFPLLLQAGAEINLFDNEDHSPVIIAIDNLHIDAVMDLVEAGADINASRSTRGLGLSPLSTAVLKGNVEMINLVLALGANPSAVDAGGWVPLHFAIGKGPGSEEVLDVMLEAGADVNIPSQSTLYPIDAAARDGHAGAIQKLLAHGADPNPVDIVTMNPPLYHAIEAGSADSVAVLLDFGAKCDITFKDGWTPMMVAAKQGEHEIGKLLFAKGNNIKESGIEALTPLHVAAMNGNRVFYKWLMEKGANSNAKDVHGRTAQSLKKGF